MCSTGLSPAGASHAVACSSVTTIVGSSLCGLWSGRKSMMAIRPPWFQVKGESGQITRAVFDVVEHVVHEGEIDVHRQQRITRTTQNGLHVDHSLLGRFHFHVVEERLVDINRIDGPARSDRAPHRQAEYAAARTDIGNRLPCFDLECGDHLGHFQACDAVGCIERLDPFLGRPASQLGSRWLGHAQGRKSRKEAGRE